MGTSRVYEPFGVDGPKCTTLMTPLKVDDVDRAQCDMNNKMPKQMPNHE